MPGADLDLLIDVARAAAKIAGRYWSGENRVWEKAPDDPVSEADHAVDTYLRETLTRARPDYGWLSEETEDNRVRRSKRRVFVVDPIDGTKAFIGGQRTWAHALGVVEDGRATEGVVLLPMRDRLYAAARGRGATLNGEPIRVPAEGGPVAGLLANRAALAPQHWPGGVPAVERAFRPSLAYRLCLVAEGRFDAMLTLRDTWEWDVAGASLIAEEAGAVVTDRAGRPLIFNSDEARTPGVLAARPGVHADLAARLRGP